MQVNNSETQGSDESSRQIMATIAGTKEIQNSTAVQAATSVGG
jgi:hypothetical protein